MYIRFKLFDLDLEIMAKLKWVKGKGFQVVNNNEIELTPEISDWFNLGDK